MSHILIYHDESIKSSKIFSDTSNKMDESRALLIQRDSDKPNNGLKSTISSESYEDSAQFQLKEQDQYVTYGAINHVIYDYFHVLLLNSTIY